MITPIKQWVIEEAKLAHKSIATVWRHLNAGKYACRAVRYRVSWRKVFIFTGTPVECAVIGCEQHKKANEGLK